MHIAHALVVRFGTTDKPESRIEDEVDVAQLRHAGGEVEIAAQRPYIRHVRLTNNVVHRFAAAGDIVDDQRPELRQGATGYLRAEGVDRQSGFRQSAT